MKKGSMYQGGNYTLLVDFPSNYPVSPPRVKFQNIIYHPNISMDGDVCVDTLKSNWKSTYTMKNGEEFYLNPCSLFLALTTVALLLSAPNPNSPLNGEAATLFKSNKPAYFAKVVDHINKYAK